MKSQQKAPEPFQNSFKYESIGILRIYLECVIYGHNFREGFDKDQPRLYCDIHTQSQFKETSHPVFFSCSSAMRKIFMKVCSRIVLVFLNRWRESNDISYKMKISAYSRKIYCKGFSWFSPSLKVRQDNKKPILMRLIRKSPIPFRSSFLGFMVSVSRSITI